MEDGFGVRAALSEIFTDLAQVVVGLIPRAITGLVVFLVGFLIAKIVQKVLEGALTRVKFDTLLERVGVKKAFEGLGVRGSLTTSIAKLVYWLILVLFIQGAATAVGLTAITDAIGSFFGYLPRIIAALLILILGNLVAQFARTAVEQSGRDSGLSYAAALGRATSAAVTFIVAIMAIAQLGIDTAMIHTIVTLLIAGTVVGFSLSFGLGTREITRNILAGFYARKIFRIGEELEVSGERGVLTAITATQTLLERDGRVVSVANRAFLDGVVRQ